MSPKTPIALVIPFYNEDSRFDFRAFLELAEISREYLQIVMVDDGSEDNLVEKIKVFVHQHHIGNVDIIKRPTNLGKADAIRFGIQSLESNNFTHIGFTDADFAAPPSEILRLAKIAFEDNKKIIVGCRVQTSRNQIVTSRFRHWQGQIFTSLTAFILGHSLTDPQCGLKFIPFSEALQMSIDTPFTNGWLFDLEILLRMNLREDIEFLEVILEKWSHVSGSKVSPADTFPVLISVLKLRNRYGKFRELKKSINTNHLD